MNKGFGVRVTVPGAEGEAPRTAPLVVVAADERDAELVAARAAGEGASAETVRELTEVEAMTYGLDLSAHGSAKALPALEL
jgi:hypothetical protein